MKMKETNQWQEPTLNEKEIPTIHIQFYIWTGMT